ncbi:hypothetical protein PT974_04945 [Cladobotryum mycophilum]|uniref:Uncharacterized protein n=1 Tax=Cladobotryum mycophilum TaxID=491253 RepID=A0ABR0SRW8_9HYPO
MGLGYSKQSYEKSDAEDVDHTSVSEGEDPEESLALPRKRIKHPLDPDRCLEDVALPIHLNPENKLLLPPESSNEEDSDETASYNAGPQFILELPMSSFRKFPALCSVPSPTTKRCGIKSSKSSTTMPASTALRGTFIICEVPTSSGTRLGGRERNTRRQAEMERQTKAMMPLEDSWKYYQELFHHLKALRYGLRRFTSLFKVTITPAAHGTIFNPLYGTPIVRAFPYGLNYPIPRGWPEGWESKPEAEPWVLEEHAAKWPGCRIVPRILVEERQHHRVSELLIDSNRLETGLNYCLFEQPSDEYRDIASILQQPGFGRLHLSLLVGQQQYEGTEWRSLRSGLLLKALSEAKDLQHFDFTTDIGDLVRAHYYLPPLLQDIFPVRCWPRLQHFGLCNYTIEQPDLVKFLSLLPQTLRSVELSFLRFLDGNYHDLLTEMRTKLDWRERRTRPSITIALGMQGRETGEAIWLEKETEDFLYDGGDNPFGLERRTEPWVHYGFGTVRDALDPDFERPWLNNLELVRLGYLKTHEFYEAIF